METRILQSEDAEEYRRLRLEALEGDPRAFSSSVEEHQALSMEEVKRRLGPIAESTFVVGTFDGGRLVGTAGFYRETGPKTRHKGHVWGVYVTPSLRGKGVGRSMMKMLLERASGIAGIEQILISVTRTQTEAVGLYRSMGFQTFGCEPRALKVAGQYVDEEYMVLFLPGRCTAKSK